jgi:hypothetical protein
MSAYLIFLLVAVQARRGAEMADFLEQAKRWYAEELRLVRGGRSD